MSYGLVSGVCFLRCSFFLSCPRLYLQLQNYMKYGNTCTPRTWKADAYKFWPSLSYKVEPCLRGEGWRERMQEREGRREREEKRRERGGVQTEVSTLSQLLVDGKTKGIIATIRTLFLLEQKLHLAEISPQHHLKKERKKENKNQFKFWFCHLTP